MKAPASGLFASRGGDEDEQRQDLHDPARGLNGRLKRTGSSVRRSDRALVSRETAAGGPGRVHYHYGD